MLNQLFICTLGKLKAASKQRGERWDWDEAHLRILDGNSDKSCGISSMIGPLKKVQNMQPGSVEQSEIEPLLSFWSEKMESV